MNITISTMRDRIQDFIENGQTADSYCIGQASLDWVNGRAEWLLTLPDGTTEWESGGCGDNLSMISDEDIQDFYAAEVADDYEEEEAV